MNLNAKQQLVLEAIRANPGAENDDALLIAKVWEREGMMRNSITSSKGLYDALRRVTRPETISRRRRELHNMGLIHYSQEADTERTEAFINERDMHAAVPWKD
jgi:hypothetical protein